MGKQMKTITCGPGSSGRPASCIPVLRLAICSREDLSPWLDALMSSLFVYSVWQRVCCISVTSISLFSYNLDNFQKGSLAYSNSFSFASIFGLAFGILINFSWMCTAQLLIKWRNQRESLF